MKKISDQKLLEKYIFAHHIEQFFPKQYFDSLLLAEYRRGEFICRQGESLESLYFFLDGKLKIVRTLINGKELVLDTREYPCILGEIEFIVNKPFVSSVVALKKTLILHFPVANRRQQLMKDADFLYNASHWLANELYQSDVNRSVNIVYSVKEQLSMLILDTQKDGDFSLELSTLADSFGTSYRHLLRVINQLIEEEVIIKNKKNTYHILDFDKLCSYAVEHKD